MSCAAANPESHSSAHWSEKSQCGILFVLPPSFFLLSLSSPEPLFHHTFLELSSLDRCESKWARRESHLSPVPSLCRLYFMATLCSSTQPNTIAAQSASRRRASLKTATPDFRMLVEEVLVARTAGERKRKQKKGGSREKKTSPLFALEISGNTHAKEKPSYKQAGKIKNRQGTERRKDEERDKKKRTADSRAGYGARPGRPL